jgi:hypothetical protein
MEESSFLCERDGLPSFVGSTGYYTAAAHRRHRRLAASRARLHPNAGMQGREEFTASKASNSAQKSLAAALQFQPVLI